MTGKPSAEGGSAEAEALARYRSASRRLRGSTGRPDRRRTAKRGVSRSGPRPDGRDPKLLGDVWRGLADGQGWTSQMAVWSLANRWAEIVGPQVAEHVGVIRFDPQPSGEARPEEVGTSPAPSQQTLLEHDDEPAVRSGGTLTLRADTPAWQQQMIWNLAHLQRRLDQDLGEGVVGRIVVLGPQPGRRGYGNRRASQ